MKFFSKSGIFVFLLSISLSSSVFAFVLTGLSWPLPQTTMHVGLTLAGFSASPSGTTWNQAFTDAAARWTNETAFNLSVSTSNPSHPCAGVLPQYPEDGMRNGAGFYPLVCDESFGDTTLAVTINYYYQSNPGVSVESDIVFNDGESWDIYDGPLDRTTIDFERVALHEQGHVIGLDHEEQQSAIMASHIGDLFTLQTDDIAGVAAIYGAAPPSNLEPIVLHIDDPAQSGTQSGINTFRGYVVSLSELASLRLYRDGVDRGELDHNGRRGDIANAFPEYPDALHSGIAFVENYGLLADGMHEYRMVARDVLGRSASHTVSFNVERYDDPFVADSSLISLQNANISNTADEITINNLMHNGKQYRLRMRWKKQRQGFEATEITRTQ